MTSVKTKSLKLKKNGKLSIIFKPAMKKKIREQEITIQHLLDNTKKTTLSVIGVRGKLDDNINGITNMFIELIAENFPKSIEHTRKQGLQNPKQL